MKQHLDKFAQSKLIRFGAVGGAGFFVNEAALFVAKGLLHLDDHAAWLFGFWSLLRDYTLLLGEKAKPLSSPRSQSR